jgi:hypothetical protein
MVAFGMPKLQITEREWTKPWCNQWPQSCFWESSPILITRGFSPLVDGAVDASDRTLVRTKQVIDAGLIIREICVIKSRPPGMAIIIHRDIKTFSANIALT